MTNKIVFYLKLVWLCFSLGFEIFLFTVDFLLHKINQKKAMVIFGTLLIFSVCIIDFYVFNKKNTPQIELKTIQINDNGQEALIKKRVILDKNQLENELKTYQAVEKMQVKNLGLLLNLSQLNKALDNQDLAQKYLDEAKSISPNISYLEN